MADTFLFSGRKSSAFSTYVADTDGWNSAARWMRLMCQEEMVR